MVEHIFDPIVTERMWLRPTPDRFWDVWGSMPCFERDRKLLLLVAALMRQFAAGLLTDPRSLAVIDVGEAYADGLISFEEVELAEDEARAAHESVRRSPAAADHAAWAAVRFLYSQNETAELLVALGGYRVASATGDEMDQGAYQAGVEEAQALIVRRIHDIFGNPFRPVDFDPSCRTSTAVGLARTMYDSRDFGAMPILADALEEAGCDRPDVLTHCRDPDGVHVRGCWVVDLVLGKS